MEVRRSQEMQRLPGASSTRAQPGEKLVAVFVYWRGLEDYDEPSRRGFIESFLCNRLVILDSEGYAYPCTRAMASDWFSGSPGAYLSREWVAVFPVWVESAGLVVHIEHPDPAEGGFRVASVSLE